MLIVSLFCLCRVVELAMLRKEDGRDSADWTQIIKLVDRVKQVFGYTDDHVLFAKAKVDLRFALAIHALANVVF